MSALAFRTNVTRLLIATRKVDCDIESSDLTDEMDDLELPSPAEIRRRCLEVQDGWTQRERSRRSGTFAVLSTWTPPRVSVGTLD